MSTVATSSRHADPSERLIRAVQDLSLARDLAAVMDIVRHAARELTGADGATFVLREGDMCYYAEEDAISPLWKGSRFPMSACISGWAMLNRQTAVIEDIYADARIPADAYRPTFVKSLAMIPIRAASPVGAIGNYWATRHAATSEEVRLLQALADSTSIAIENVQLLEGMEARIRERTAELETANRELEAFSYSVSHDLRSPLRAIDGFSQSLIDHAGDALDEEGRQYLRRIRAAAGRMSQLIEDLLGLSRVVRAELRRESVDLAAMAREIVETLRAATPGRDVNVDIAVPMRANADPRLLRVVLQNLLDNAWKYTSRTENARIAFGSAAIDGRQVYCVSDNGAGFDMAYADKLFAAFQRLHSEREFPGTGIGLATVQRVISRHGGRIWAESEVGRGTTFRFTLGD